MKTWYYIRLTLRKFHEKVDLPFYVSKKEAEPLEMSECLKKGHLLKCPQKARAFKVGFLLLTSLLILTDTFRKSRPCFGVA